MGDIRLQLSSAETLQALHLSGCVYIGDWRPIESAILMHSIPLRIHISNKNQPSARRESIRLGRYCNDEAARPVFSPPAAQVHVSLDAVSAASSEQYHHRIHYVLALRTFTYVLVSSKINYHNLSSNSRTLSTLKPRIS